MMYYYPSVDVAPPKAMDTTELGATAEMAQSLLNRCGLDGRRWWWATHVASKNRFTSSLPGRLEAHQTQSTRISGLRLCVCVVRSVARSCVEAIKVGVRGIRVKAAVRVDWRRILSGADIVIKSFVYQRNLAKRQNYGDPFFGRLPSILSRDRSIAVLYESIGSAYRIGNRIGRALDVPLVSIDHVASPIDVFWSWALAVRATFGLAKEARNRALPFPLRAVFAYDGPQVSVNQALLERVLQKVGKRGKPLQYIQTYENNPWEKVAIRGVRKGSPSTEVIGYQHAAVPAASLGMFLTSSEVRQMPLPDVVVTTGPTVRELLLSHSAPNGPRVRVGCALRYEYLQTASSRSGPVEKHVLVALEGVKPALKLARIALDAACLNLAIKFTLRFHPAMPYELVRGDLPDRTSWPATVAISTAASVRDDVCRSGLCFYWGSTVAIEALAFGLPVVSFRSASSLVFDPLFTCPFLHSTVQSSYELVEAVDLWCKREIRVLSEERTQALEYVRDYFAPVGEEGIQSFIQGSC